MKLLKTFRLFNILLVFLLVSTTFAQETSIKNLYKYTLENGLTLFVAENHTVPLAYIEIAVKCGAFTQDKENAGLFHLYEHMMFKGNSLYPNAASVNQALSKMGVSEWNGSTAVEWVNYFFTVPSEQTEKGLEFWSAAIRTPLLNKKEFSNEKKVVISEITANFSDPGRILYAAKCSKLFKDSAWKLDMSGSPTIIKNATLKQLKEIQKKYYVPNNSALFVGGDINHEEVYELVKKIYGSWEKGENPHEKDKLHHSHTPFSEPQLLVMPFEKISPDLAQIGVTFRGPDALFEVEDTYPIDILSMEFSNPQSAFVSSFVSDEYIGIPDSSFVWGNYATSSTSGMINFGAQIIEPQNEIAKRAIYFAEKIPSVVAASTEISNERIKNIVQKIEDTNIYEAQTAAGLLSSIRFLWICADADYYFTYSQKMGEVKSNTLKEIAEKYIIGKKPLITVLINPDVYKLTKDQFIQSGFSEVTNENAFWFNQK